MSSLEPKSSVGPNGLRPTRASAGTVITQYLLRNFLVHTAVRLKRTVDQGANRLLIAGLILGRGRRLFLGSHARKQSAHDDDKKKQEHGFEQHPNNPLLSLRSAAPAACSWPYPRQSLYHRQGLCHPRKGATPGEPWPASGPRCSQSPLRADSLEQFFILTPGFCFVGPATRKPISPEPLASLCELGVDL